MTDHNRNVRAKIERCTLSLTLTRPYVVEDAEAGVFNGTASVVDRAQGIILTAGHVTSRGPFTAQAHFPDRSDVSISSISSLHSLPHRANACSSAQCMAEYLYVDPEYDHILLKVDPAKLTDELVLKPERACVGETVYVAGNAKGEKYNIHQGIIGQVDRRPASYDSNVAYMTISTKPGGGSSGSPVVTTDGMLVGLLTGSFRESSICLASTIDSVQRALTSIKAGQYPIRRTLQVTWEEESWVDCSRLRLSDASRRHCGKSRPDKKGLLVAKKVFPSGPSSGILEEGDILTQVAKTVAPSLDEFQQGLEETELVDEDGCRVVPLIVQRGGQDLSVQARVDDLHDLACSRICVYMGAVFHRLSYTVLRSRLPSRKGIYLAEPGQLLPHIDGLSGAIIHQMGSQEINDLEDFIQSISPVECQQGIHLLYTPVGSQQPKIVFVQLNRCWETDLLEYETKKPLGGWQVKRRSIHPVQKSPPKTYELGYIPDYGLHGDHSSVAAFRSLVKVSSSMPYVVDSDGRNSATGLGCIIQPEEGVVLVSRKFVPHRFCLITVRIAGSVDLPANVVAVDATQGFVKVQYDATCISTPLSRPSFNFTPLRPGEDVCFVGLDDDGTRYYAKTRTTDVSPYVLTPNSEPVYQPWLQDTLVLDSAVAPLCSSGIITDTSGDIRALWSEWHNAEGSCLYATPVHRLRSFIEISPWQPPVWNIEVEAVSIAECRQLGLGDDRIREVEDRAPRIPQLFRVREVHASLTPPQSVEPQDQQWRIGDIIIHLDGQIVVAMEDFDRATSQADVDALVLRLEDEVTLRVMTLAPEQLETQRFVNFYGATLQQPHHAIRRRREILPSLIFVSSVRAGSLSVEASVSAPAFITHFNNVAVWDLDDLLRENKVSHEKRTLKFVRLDENEPQTVALKRNELLGSVIEYLPNGKIVDHGS
ncbi:hypothetical protein H2202_011136 [Exophiala xenobiotica]|nr:hypothetical protein H2202_011136 [Exophiala xenobiotica]KAK5215603.1 hypothetical protein LTR72_011345 [Exophiala xenobiotica]KAK5284740.1 hypothetical protein LTR14_011529 [Exophiala xenobiotica]KAK5469097.1 hypothetical protein LTR55_011361 [Exophiala xenobiotica]